MTAVKTQKTLRCVPTRGAVRSENHKVLVVDDDRQITHALAESLQNWGYVVFQANNASEAITIARQERIDVALLDVCMPREDGFRVLQLLKENDAQLLAVMMTGYGDIAGARRAMRLGAYDYITKPFELKTLRAVLKEGLS